MTAREKREYEAIPTVKGRAEWLLNKGVSATIDINPKTLGLVAKPTACGVILPGEYESEQQAIEEGTRFLRERAA